MNKENVSFTQDLKMIVFLVKMVIFLKYENQENGKGVSCLVGYDEYGYTLSMNKFRTVYGNLEEN